MEDNFSTDCGGGRKVWFQDDSSTLQLFFDLFLLLLQQLYLGSSGIRYQRRGTPVLKDPFDTSVRV